MLIEFDSAKREQTLIDRGLDFADTPKIFSGKYFSLADDRADRIVVLIWTPRGKVRALFR